MSSKATVETERMIRVWMDECARAVERGDEHQAEARRNWAFGAYMAWSVGDGRLVEVAARNAMAELAGLR